MANHNELSGSGGSASAAYLVLVRGLGRLPVVVETQPIVSLRIVESSNEAIRIEDRECETASRRS
jgi:hypothetical protein